MSEYGKKAEEREKGMKGSKDTRSEYGTKEDYTAVDEALKKMHSAADSGY